MDDPVADAADMTARFVSIWSKTCASILPQDSATAGPRKSRRPISARRLEPDRLACKTREALPELEARIGGKLVSGASGRERRERNPAKKTGQPSFTLP
jgi:hypothetical protein